MNSQIYGPDRNGRSVMATAHDIRVCTLNTRQPRGRIIAKARASGIRGSCSISPARVRPHLRHPRWPPFERFHCLQLLGIHLDHRVLYRLSKRVRIRSKSAVNLDIGTPYSHDDWIDRRRVQMRMREEQKARVASIIRLVESSL
jgi:hypothetical protein